MSEKTDLRTIKVDILGKEYPVHCPSQAEAELREAMQYLEDKIKGIQDKGRASANAISSERILAMAALNLANEVIAQRQGREAYVLDINEKIERLTQKIAQSLACQGVE